MKPLTKYMWRNIRQSKGRFIAIILIILLGTLIFTGVKAAGPALNDSLDTTIKKQKLSDVQVFSTTGFTKKDILTAEKVKGATATTTKFKYALEKKQAAVVALYGYTATQSQNKPQLRSGHFPQKPQEIVLDQQAKTKYHYHLGQQFTFKKSANLKRQSYTIVGFADAPQYIDNQTRGSANIGDGTVRFFAYLPEDQLNLAVATMLNVRFETLQAHNTYQKDYRDLVAKKKAALKRKFKSRGLQRSATLRQAPNAQFAQQETQLNQTIQQLTQTGDTQSTLYRQLIQQKRQLSSAKKKLQQTTKTTYTWQTRDDLPGFEAYGESSERIAAIANVFPVFFFLIAALITFTTVTRMVEENRVQIGTFKALGYNKRSIARNYLVYATLAGSIGAILGSIIGNEALPRIVLMLYSAYIPLIYQVDLQWATIGIALIFALLATLGAAAFVVGKELSEGPATLMRPRSPKSAKRILLERIQPLWQSMSFNRKVSYRNLFRFKSRLWMTIIGIAGGTALILTGFGIQNSIAASGERQYNEIFHYQAIVRLKHPDATKAQTVLAKNKQYLGSTKLASDFTKIRHGDHQIDSVNLYVPQSVTSFQKRIHLQDPQTKKTLILPKKGVILTQKAAEQLHVNIHDTVHFTTAQQIKGKAKVAGITQNFTGHFAYFRESAYQNSFHQKPQQNTLLVQLNSQTGSQRDQLAQQLLTSGDALATSYTYTQQHTMSQMAGTLDPIVAIFILLSGILSFVVLYNLTNINISERIRELSTIKVLGFYDREVTLYIVRENIVLTLVGIVVGYGVGNLLTAYILHQAATAQVIFPLTIHWQGYLVATLLMILFTLIVLGVTHKKLQHIDMIDALKSNE